MIKRILFIFTLTVMLAAVGNSQIVSVEDAAKNALKAGAKAPSFELKDHAGNLVSSKSLLKNDNLVVVFYRGAWCPFCNTYLRSLQKRLDDITAAGGKLVAISVENADNSMAVSKKNELTYTVLSDPNLDTARKFGIVFQLPADTAEMYASRGLDLVKRNGTDKPELPLGATYVIAKDGTIKYAFIETDYKKRAEPDVIIENLRELKR